ncbi:ABC transporter, putative [Ixodes scapularis]|uniref:ABC transporter, putative n=1 Tax=Ixodes scapularis TaxID=6945 RepID=B7QK11_IXOSC|nr:ABC transporter, putative [Ixodes scapularis]|eukprot:XP_002415518.1 ABC transporter, putative [Ixodes scapularis]
MPQQCWVILLDEPTLGLDSQDKRRVWAVLLSMRAKSTIVLSTHDVEEADLLADRILLMGQRTLLCSGSPRYVEALLDSKMALSGSARTVADGRC